MPSESSVAPAFVPVDQAVRDEIATALDANLCVEAGAGTGKTTALVRRVVEVLCGGRATIDDLVVITFTEKAAAELSARVRQELERAAAGDSGERALRARAALDGLHRARIETHHAFAAALLRERPVEARLDPGFVVLDDVAASLDFERERRDWLREVYSREDRRLIAMLDRGFGLEELRATADALHRHRALLPLRLPVQEPLDVDAVAAELARHVASLRSLDADCAAESDRGHRQLAELFAFAEECARRAGEPERLVRLFTGAAPRLAANCGSQANWSPSSSLVEVKTTIGEEVKPLIGRAVERLRTEALLLAMPLAQEFVVRAAESRRGAGRADFDDLLIWARDLLRDNAEVRGFFRRRFGCVLIDEFQDTDPVQTEVAMLLSIDEELSAPAGELAFATPGPGRMFAVGDPKQSIYRFRGADIALYQRIREEVLADGRRTIRQNFRTVGGILEWVNRVFDRELVADDGVQPANVALAPARPDAVPGTGRPPVVVVHGSGALRKHQGPEIRAEEAPLLAGLIRRAVVEEAWPIEDPESGELRPARWEDVVILMPTRTGVDVYERALEQAGVPHRMERHPEFYARAEVRELVSILHAIEDPTDRLSLVAALRSRACACSDEAVAAWFAAGNRLDYRGGHEPGPGDHEAVRESLAVLRSLHLARAELPLGELVAEALRRTAMVEASLLEPGGSRAAANLRKVAEQARAFSAAGEGGLRDFAAWLATGRDEDADEVDATVTEDGDAAVLLATMHSTKGLEFPIVCLAGCGENARYLGEPIPDREGRSLALRVGTERNGHFKTPGFDALSEIEKVRYRAAERLRLLYVATTRARDHLVVPVVPKRDCAGPMLAAMLPDLPEWDEARAGEAVDGCWLYDRRLLADASAAACSDADGAASDEEVRAALAERSSWERARGALLETAGAGRSVQTASGASAEAELRAGGVGAAPAFAIAEVDREGARRLGDAVHQVLELVELPAADDGVRALAVAAAHEHLIPERAGEVAELAAACLASPVVEAAAASGSPRREVPFTIAEPDGSLLTGRADLVHREGDSLVVVDYKTDAATTPAEVDERLAHHRPQAAVYAEALGRATGLPVTRVVFVFARAEAERAVSFS